MKVQNATYMHVWKDFIDAVKKDPSQIEQKFNFTLDNFKFSAFRAENYKELAQRNLTTFHHDAEIYFISAKHPQYPKYFLEMQEKQEKCLATIIATPYSNIASSLGMKDYTAFFRRIFNDHGDKIESCRKTGENSRIGNPFDFVWPEKCLSEEPLKVDPHDSNDEPPAELREIAAMLKPACIVASGVAAIFALENLYNSRKVPHATKKAAVLGTASLALALAAYALHERT